MTRSQRRWAGTIAKARARKVLIIWHEPGKSAPITEYSVGRAAAMHCTCPCGVCTHKAPDKMRREKRDMEKLHYA